MKRLTADQLQPGTRLSDHLFSIHGVKLLPRGEVLTRSLIERLGAMGCDFCLAGSVSEVSALASAQKAGTCDESTSGHRAVANFFRRMSDSAIRACETNWEPANLAIPSVGTSIDLCASAQGQWLSNEEVAGWRAARKRAIQAEFDRIVSGNTPKLAPFDQVALDLLQMVRLCPPRFIQLAAVEPLPQANYLPDHAISTACIAVAVAARLKWALGDIHVAALAGLLHDIGMLALPAAPFLNQGHLSDLDRNHILQHPAYSVSILQSMAGLSPAVLCAAYRHHERDDGMGYPRGLRASKIGELPRLIAVADTAAAILGPRVFRPAHESLEAMIEITTQGKLNRSMVRAAVEVVGTYPIGSFVRLSDNEIARVVGVHPHAPDRPIVQYCDPDSGTPLADVVDLALDHEPWELSVLIGVTDPRTVTNQSRQRKAG